MGLCMNALADSSDDRPKDKFAVTWSDKIDKIEGRPELVRSSELPYELYQDLLLQIKLFGILMGVSEESDITPQIDEAIKDLQEVFDNASFRHSPSQTGYEADDASHLGFNRRVFGISNVDKVNGQMLSDFKHTVANASLEEMDHVIDNLDFKYESWNEKLSKSPQGNSFAATSTGYSKSFLRTMNLYIKDWKNLRAAIEGWRKRNPSTVQARKMWVAFEEDKQAVLNAYIARNATERWTVPEDGVVEAYIPARDTFLYLHMKVMGREFYFPLTNGASDSLGMYVHELR